MSEYKHFYVLKCKHSFKISLCSVENNCRKLIFVIVGDKCMNISPLDEYFMWTKLNFVQLVVEAKLFLYMWRRIQLNMCRMFIIIL